MKPSRKLNRGSFMSRVSGGGGVKAGGGQGKGAPESDHDLVQPGQPAGGGPDADANNSGSQN
jgi:hypothetical protein